VAAEKEAAEKEAAERARKIEEAAAKLEAERLAWELERLAVEAEIAKQAEKAQSEKDALMQGMSDNMATLTQELGNITASNELAEKEAAEKAAADMRADMRAAEKRALLEFAQQQKDDRLKQKTVFADISTSTDLPKSALIVVATPTDLQLVERTSGRIAAGYGWRDVLGCATPASNGHIESDDMELLVLNLADGRELKFDCFSAATVQAYISDGLWKYQHKHLAQWNCDELYIWVRGIGPSFHDFAEKLTHVGLDGAALLHLTAFELSNLVRLLVFVC
jgi:hypothetical protein